MSNHNTLSRIAPWILVAAGLTLGAGTLFADVNGRTGKAQSANGCNCHGSNAPAVNVAIAGPQSVATGSTHQYTVTVTGGPTAGGGFDLKASGGALVAGTNNHVVGAEVTHNDGASRSWTFSWTAPATAGAQNFWAIAVSANNSGDESGDQWNFYGGVVNTAFPITVTDAAGVDASASLTWLAPPSPNPCANGTRIAFSLANAGTVRVELLDAAGRRVSTLANGAMSAGRQTVEWNGRSDSGSRVAAGVYFVRMTAPGAEFTKRMVVE